MLLYHGTTKRVADAASTEGLKPRGEGAGNWADRPSRPDCVYLAFALGATYAVSTSVKANEPDTVECAIIEIDAPDDGGLLPDEDFLTECVLMAYIGGEFPDPGDIKKRALSASLRDTLEAYEGTNWLQVLHERHTEYKPIDPWVKNCERNKYGAMVKGWEASINGLGTCAYKGVVAAGSIRRIAYLKRSHQILQWLGSKNVKTSIYEYQQNIVELFNYNRVIFGDMALNQEQERMREGIRVVQMARG